MSLTVVDAGVLIGVLEALDSHHAASVRGLRSARARGDDFIVPASAYAELLVQPAREGEEAVRSVDAALDALRIRVEPLTREMAAAAARLRAVHGRRLRLPDALVVATAEATRAKRLLTTDAGTARVSRVAVLTGGS